MGDGNDSESATALRERFPKRYRNGHLCLGDVMDESITWLEPSADSEPCSPKEDTRPDMTEMHDEDTEAPELECGEYMKQVMKVVSRQQRAPGIIVGLPKSLSC